MNRDCGATYRNDSLSCPGCGRRLKLNPLEVKLPPSTPMETFEVITSRGIHHPMRKSHNQRLGSNALKTRQKVKIRISRAVSWMLGVVGLAGVWLVLSVAICQTGHANVALVCLTVAVSLCALKSRSLMEKLMLQPSSFRVDIAPYRLLTAVSCTLTSGIYCSTCLAWQPSRHLCSRDLNRLQELSRGLQIP